MPTDEDKLGVLSKLAMFQDDASDEDEDEDEGGDGRARLAGGSRPLTSAGARALVQEAHEDMPTPHEEPPDPQGGGEDPSPRPRARPGQPSARQDVAQVARPMGGPPDEDEREPPTRSLCARLRARLRAHFTLNEQAAQIMDSFITELHAAGAAKSVVDAMTERVDEWQERVTDAVVM